MPERVTGWVCEGCTPPLPPPKGGGNPIRFATSFRVIILHPAPWRRRCPDDALSVEKGPVPVGKPAGSLIQGLSARPARLRTSAKRVYVKVTTKNHGWAPRASAAPPLLHPGSETGGTNSPCANARPSKPPSAAVAVEHTAIALHPLPRLFELRAVLCHQRPEFRTMVHMREMRHLMRRHIIQNDKAERR